MARTMSATEARVHFGEVLRRVVDDGEPIVVERGGRPLAVVLSIDEYRRLRGGDDNANDWRALLAMTHDTIRAEQRGRLSPAPEEVIRAEWEERDAAVVADLR